MLVARTSSRRPGEVGRMNTDCGVANSMCCSSAAGPPDPLRGSPTVESVQERSTPTEKIRVAVVDNHPMVLEGVRTILEGDPDGRFLVVGTGASLDELKQYGPVECDLLVLDLYLTGEPADGVEPDFDVVREASSEHQVLVMSVSARDEDVFDVVNEFPVSGYFHKAASPDEVRRAAATVAGGGEYVSQELAGVVLRERERRKDIESMKALSPREEEVLRLVFDGLTHRMIANRLNISEHVVNDYLKRIRYKWGPCPLVKRGLELGVLRHPGVRRLRFPRPSRRPKAK
jgi:two-component system, NarL family, nitrate/nitrite response regulator NarL